MSESDKPGGSKPKLPEYSLSSFLLTVAPNELVRISDLWMREHGFRGSVARKVNWPKLLTLSCGYCKGDRHFAPIGDAHLDEKGSYVFHQFKCKNCERTLKTFAMWLQPDMEPNEGTGRKYGEQPPFGPLVSADVEQLLDTSAELFRKGHQCESAGLGIGAFVYYRRVLEDQRVRIFEQLIAVAEKLGADAGIVAQLRAAAAERQFTKALDEIKPGLPTALYINGHNPLTLLHDALSDGVHDKSDAECLSLAQTIRLLLTDLAQRIQQALAKHDDVEDAVNKLLKAKAARLERDKQRKDGK